MFIILKILSFKNKFRGFSRIQRSSAFRVTIASRVFAVFIIHQTKGLSLSKSVLALLSEVTGSPKSSGGWSCVLWWRSWPSTKPVTTCRILGSWSTSSTTGLKSWMPQSPCEGLAWSEYELEHSPVLLEKLPNLGPVLPSCPVLFLRCRPFCLVHGDLCLCSVRRTHTLSHT